MAPVQLMTEEEKRVMKLEFEWLLQEEVPKVLYQVKLILKECKEKFKLPVPGKVTTEEGKLDNFPLTSPNSDILKGYVAVDGFNICKADLKFKLPRSVFRTYVTRQKPWKLQQVQDAFNNLEMASERVNEVKQHGPFVSAIEVHQVMDEIVTYVTRGKMCLAVPEKQSVINNLHSNSQAVFDPYFPDELTANFYVNAEKLVLSCFVLNTLPVPPQPLKPVLIENAVGFTFEHNSKWMEISNHFEVDCLVPWLGEVLVLCNVSLQLCQQLKDKVSIFPPSVTK